MLRQLALIALLITASLRAAAANQPNKCVLAFLPKSFGQMTDAQFLEPEFKRLFTRFENAEVRDPNYLRNISASLVMAFIPWFHGQPGSYREMLRQQHRIAGYGPAQTFSDGNFYRGEAGVSIFTVWPGRLRSDVLALFRSLGVLDINAPGGFNTDAETIEKDEVRQIPVAGIQKKDWPQQFRSESGSDLRIRHAFPGRFKLRAYLNRMEALMGEIRELPKNCDQDILLGLVGEYYYVAIHSHVFFRINNSLFMSQVNYILNYHGLRGITHGTLDFVALDSEQGVESFLPVFKRRVLRENP